MPDFDASLDRDWREFRRTLADRLAYLPKGERFDLSCPDDPRGGAVLDFRVTGHNRIRIELSTAGQPVDAAPLCTDGWRELRSGAVVLEVGRKWADLAATQAVRVLRDVFGIVHPAFVFGHGRRSAPLESRVQVGVEPHSREHLRRLVDDALESIVCGGPEHEPCGCVRFEVGGLVSWLRVLPDEKVLQFFTWLGPSAVPQSAQVIAEANGRCRGIQIGPSGDRVFAALHVDAAVFVVADLARALRKWLAFMRDESGEIARQLAGFGEPEDAEPLPPGLQCLLHLDPDASMPARDVATVCGNDRDAIVDYLRICAEQEASWRATSADATETSDADAADHEADSWARTAATLREALRLVILGARGTANG